MDAASTHHQHDPRDPRHGRRFYAFTDNGDWMEMRPQTGGEPASGVWFMALDNEAEDDFFEQASDGIGVVLARVTIVDGEPVLHSARDLIATEPEFADD